MFFEYLVEIGMKESILTTERLLFICMALVRQTFPRTRRDKWKSFHEAVMMPLLVALNPKV